MIFLKIKAIEDFSMKWFEEVKQSLAISLGISCGKILYKVPGYALKLGLLIFNKINIKMVLFFQKDDQRGDDSKLDFLKKI